jgi:hypothetical protein
MTDLPRALLGDTAAPVDNGKPPQGELGAETQRVGGPGGWSSFIDEAEFVPELTFPSSIPVYHRMRSDPQIEALHLGTVQPIREYRWMIDPNKAPKRIVENCATDLGLPIKGEEADEGIKRAANKFGFDRWLSDALLGPLYGFMHFEIVGRVEEAKDWRMSKLAPRHPRTIQQFKSAPTGELEAIKQNFGQDFAATPPEIVASRLVPLVWRPEAGSHVGRSMLRSMYREWLVKDRTLRIAVINLERAGGVPVIEGPQGASNRQLEDLAQMARQFKVAEGGGGAIPFGSKLSLAGGSVPDAIALLQYCDEAMARVWALMLVQLGQTQTGSRALGGEFAIYAARAQRLMAEWIAEAANSFLDRYTDWNDPLADYAPLLRFEPSKPEGLSVTDLVSLVDAGVLTVDPELEEWMRAEFALPDKPEAPDAGDLGELTPDEQTLILNSRNPPVNPDGTPAVGAPAKPNPNPDLVSTPLPKKSLDPTVTSPTIASTGTRNIPRIRGGIRASLTLPDRQLRRAPSANEIRAAVDFKALDDAHSAITARLHHDYINGALPTQIGALADQVRAGVKAADLAAPIAGLERLQGHLATAASSGTSAAIREAQVQGVALDHARAAEIAQAARDRVLTQAEHVATLNANGLTLGAQRRAGRLASKVRSPERVAKDLERHLTGQKHVFERENLKGAVTQAQNTGRIATFEAIAQAADPGTATAVYEASEILDERTCGPCEAVDGNIYEDLSDAEADYSSGGYVDCEGGPNCRGTLVAVYPEQNPVGGEGNLREAEPSYTQPDTGGGESGGGLGDVTPDTGGPGFGAGEVIPEALPEAAPAAETAPPPEETRVAGPLLTQARGIETHEAAVAFLKDDLGIAQVDLGDKIARAMSGSGQQAEHAKTTVKGIVESIAEARDTFGLDATHIDAVFTSSGAKRSGGSRAAKSGIGRAHAAVRTLTNTITREVSTHLIVNDTMSFAEMAASDLHETSGGFVAKATTDVRGRVMHEMGHVLEDNLPGFTTQLPKMLAESGLASTAQQRGVARFVSQYATTKSVETWAESFATLMREGGVAQDFSIKSETANLQLQRMAASADGDTKAALVKLRELWNAWAAETYPNLPHIPER